MSAAYSRCSPTQWEHGVLITFPSMSEGWGQEGPNQTQYWLVEDLDHFCWAKSHVCPSPPYISCRSDVLSCYESALLCSDHFLSWPLPSEAELEKIKFPFTGGNLETQNSISAGCTEKKNWESWFFFSHLGNKYMWMSFLLLRGIIKAWSWSRTAVQAIYQ